MTEQISFFVPGTPAPQGSKRHVGGGRMVESSKALGPWRGVVTMVAQQTVAKQRWVTPEPSDVVHVSLRFEFVAPKNRLKLLENRQSIERTVKPDLDKLIRAVLDALTDARAIYDDSQVTRVTASKSETKNSAGVHIQITKGEPS